MGAVVTTDDLLGIGGGVVMVPVMDGQLAQVVPRELAGAAPAPAGERRP